MERSSSNVACDNNIPLQGMMTWYSSYLLNFMHFNTVGDKTMVSWLLDNFPETAHIANSNGDQIVHFAAAEGRNLHCNYTISYKLT